MMYDPSILLTTKFLKWNHDSNKYNILVIIT